MFRSTRDLAMPKNCCVVGCTNNSVKRNDLSFYLIPSEATEPQRREKWLQAIGRGVTPTSTKLWRPKSEYHYLCSTHFISGKCELFYLVSWYFMCVSMTFEVEVGNLGPLLTRTRQQLC